MITDAVVTVIGVFSVVWVVLYIITAAIETIIKH